MVELVKEVDLYQYIIEKKIILEMSIKEINLI